MRTPEFWSDKNLISIILYPISLIFGLLSQLKKKLSKPAKVSIPVICVGNAVAGGAGKTPIALAIADILKNKRNKKIHFLSRGYGGNYSGCMRVEKSKHNSNIVGDEALLLADKYPIWVCKDRHLAAKNSINAGAEVIVMDDGLQHYKLQKDLCILVVDGRFNFGNNMLIPSGPMRETLDSAIGKCQLAVVLNDYEGITCEKLQKRIPTIKAKTLPTKYNPRILEKPVLAFAGIGNPEKFYLTLKEIGCDIYKMIGFGDHKKFSDNDIKTLVQEAKDNDAILVTTAKDATRIDKNLLKNIYVVAIEIEFENKELLIDILDKTIN